MIEVRPATVNDVQRICDLFQTVYGDSYPYPHYYDPQVVTRLVYDEGTVLLVAEDTENGRIVGTASVVFGVSALNDLLGEFGRLVVDPQARGQGVGRALMEGRIERVRDRLHVGIVENRVTHPFSQRISDGCGFVPVGFLPMKLELERRESAAMFARHFGDALALRRNNPRVIPEAARLAAMALENCQLPGDCIIDDSSAPLPWNDSFQLDELRTEGYTSLLRIERGRLQHRTVFGPVRLHYGLFQLRTRRSHYLLARQDGHVAGGIGFMVDKIEKAVRILELIALSDQPSRFLLQRLIDKCQHELGIEYIEVDVSAYAPQMQRTLLELNFLPAAYVPAMVFHDVERLDAIKMVRLLVPFDVGQPQIIEQARPIAETVIRGFATRDVAPRIATALKGVPLFEGLSDEQRYWLIGCSTLQTFRAGARIYGEGQASDRLHLVLEGEVDATAGAGNRLVGTIGRGQCLGESSLLDDANRTHSVTATAKTDVETAAFDSADFAHLVRRRPDIAVVIYRNLAADVSGKLKNARRQLEA